MHALQSSSFIAVDRRKFLAGASALVAAGLLPRKVLALAAPYNFKQGALDVTVVSDGNLVLPTKILAPDISPEELKSLLTAAGVTGDKIEPATNATLIKAGNDVILFDTGSGSGFQPTSGKLRDSLAAAGIEPSSITKVVYTHAHPDHLWGTHGADGKLSFPNAAHYAATTEWDFWTDAGLVNKMPKDMQAMVQNTQKHLGGTKGKVTLVKPGEEIVAGIRVLDTAGHTPGHVSFEVPGGEGLIIMGDVIVYPVTGFPHPDWRFGFDADGNLAIENRKKMLDRAATDKTKLLGYHWPYPGLAYAEKKDTGYRYAPAS